MTVPADHNPASDADPIIIIGSGLAGYGLAREIRRYNTEVPIVIVTADGGEVYSKPLISTGYTKQLSVEKLAMQQASDIAAQLSVTVHTRSRVASIDVDARQIQLESGESMPYRDLVLTLGAEVIRPPMSGDALDDVLSVNDLDDYGQFQQRVLEKGVRKVAIIGAGLIGCEFTNDLLNGGYETESVDPMGWCLPTLLPEPCGHAVQRALEDKGAKFHFGALAQAVNHTDNGYRVELDNGEHIDADLVLSAVGVRPRTALAEAAGIAVGRGIKTDRCLRTSAPHVYAFGDCAEVEGHVLVYVAPLMAAARSLGATLVGKETPVVYPAMPVTIKTPACPVTVSPVPRDAHGEWIIEGTAPDLKATFRAASGQLLGYALTGSAIREKGPLTKELPPILG
jgi:rubredoxin-NAD+ reductase